MEERLLLFVFVFVKVLCCNVFTSFFFFRRTRRARNLHYVFLRAHGFHTTSVALLGLFVIFVVQILDRAFFAARAIKKESGSIQISLHQFNDTSRDEPKKLTSRDDPRKMTWRDEPQKFKICVKLLFKKSFFFDLELDLGLEIAAL